MLIMATPTFYGGYNDKAATVRRWATENRMEHLLPYPRGVTPLAHRAVLNTTPGNWAASASRSEDPSIRVVSAARAVTPEVGNKVAMNSTARASAQATTTPASLSTAAPKNNIFSASTVILPLAFAILRIAVTAVGTRASTKSLRAGIVQSSATLSTAVVLGPHP